MADGSLLAMLEDSRFLARSNAGMLDTGLATIEEFPATSTAKSSPLTSNASTTTPVAPSASGASNLPLPQPASNAPWWRQQSHGSSSRPQKGVQMLSMHFRRLPYTSDPAEGVSASEQRRLDMGGSSHAGSSIDTHHSCHSPLLRTKRHMSAGDALETRMSRLRRRHSSAGITLSGSRSGACAHSNTDAASVPSRSAWGAVAAAAVSKGGEGNGTQLVATGVSTGDTSSGGAIASHGRRGGSWNGCVGDSGNLSRNLSFDDQCLFQRMQRGSTQSSADLGGGMWVCTVRRDVSLSLPLSVHFLSRVGTQIIHWPWATVYSFTCFAFCPMLCTLLLPPKTWQSCVCAVCCRQRLARCQTHGSQV